MNRGLSDSSISQSSLTGSRDPIELIKARILQFAANSEEDKALEILKGGLEREPSLTLFNIRDLRGYTVLHLAAVNGLQKLTDFIFKHLDEKYKQNEKLSFINIKTNEGFTALHFSSFRGNMKLLHILTERGADINAKNDRGLNMIHVAAQGDNPFSIAFFLRKGVDLAGLDNKGSTALHWAAFLGSENATNYLIAWGADPNRKDHEDGLTPFHLAIMSGNVKIVRKLLTKGADKNIRNKEGKNALELAKFHEAYQIVQLIRGRNFLLELCSIAPGLGSRRNRSLLFIFFLIYPGFHVLLTLLILPFTSQFWTIVLFFAFFIVVMALFLKLWRSDPGFLRNKKQQDIIIVVPARARHCELCKSCVQVFDHHCPWIDNCIGARNLRYFYVFVLILLADLIYLTGFSLANIDNNSLGQLIPLSFDIALESLVTIKLTVIIVTTLTCLVFIILLSLLAYVQTRNILLGKTTNERFSRRISTSERVGESKITLNTMSDSNYSLLQDESSQKGCRLYTQNCMNMCFRNANNLRYNSVE